MLYQYFVGRHFLGDTSTKSVLGMMVEQSWDRLRRLGFDGVYLTGVFDHRGPIVVMEEEGKALGNEKRTPSVFAINDHTIPDPTYGTEDELRALIRTLHAHGLRVVVDYVPNQTGHGHAWVKQHPDYYLYEHGKMQTGFSGDVYLLDLNRPDVVLAQREVLTTLMEYGVDGVRCDMAHLAPIGFWQGIIDDMRTLDPDFVFIAEAYGADFYDWSVFERLRDEGFDYVYHSQLFVRLGEILRGERTLADLAGHLAYLMSSGTCEHLVHYVMNHDDVISTLASSELQVLSVLIALLNGEQLFFNGQLLGRARRLSHHSLEMLPNEQDELLNVPSWFQEFQDMYLQHHESIVKVWAENDILYLQSTGCLCQLRIGEGAPIPLGTGEVLWKLVDGPALMPTDVCISKFS